MKLGFDVCKFKKLVFLLSKRETRFFSKKPMNCYWFEYFTSHMCPSSGISILFALFSFFSFKKRFIQKLGLSNIDFVNLRGI